jgi:hypothetical protein
LRGELAGLLRRELAIHDTAAAHAQIGTMLDHAGGDLRNVRDFRTAEPAAKEVVKASTKLILRTVLKKAAVIFGSCWPSYVGRLLTVATCARNHAPTVTDVTQP